jgi:hypothetical protein
MITQPLPRYAGVTWSTCHLLARMKSPLGGQFVKSGWPDSNRRPLDPPATDRVSGQIRRSPAGRHSPARMVLCDRQSASTSLADGAPRSQVHPVGCRAAAPLMIRDQIVPLAIAIGTCQYPHTPPHDRSGLRSLAFRKGVSPAVPRLRGSADSRYPLQPAAVGFPLLLALLLLGAASRSRRHTTFRQPGLTPQCHGPQRHHGPAGGFHDHPARRPGRAPAARAIGMRYRNVPNLQLTVASRSRRRTTLMMTRVTLPPASPRPC